METRKIVINARYGGFSLSREAFLQLREAGVPAAVEEPDYGELYSDGSGPRKKCLGDGFCRDIPRDAPELVDVVERMGPAAGGWAASLEIVEIPADVEWKIEEYDGLEWVAEKHRTWPCQDFEA